MERIGLQCSIDEWYWARSRLKIGFGNSKALKLKTERLKKFVNPLFLMFSTTLLNGVLFFGGIETVFYKGTEIVVGVLLLLLFIYGVYLFVRVFREYRNYLNTFLNHPDGSGEITLYAVTKSGVSVNFYNMDQYSFTFQWEDIKALTEEITPLGERNIVLEMKNNKKNILPLPQTWNESGLSERFIDFIQKRVCSKDDLEEGFDLVEAFSPGFYNRFYRSEKEGIN